MLLARVVNVNLDHLVRDLMAGDLVVWAIVIGVVFFSGLGLYQKLRSFAPKRGAETK